MTDQYTIPDLGPIQLGHVYLTRDGEQVTIESVNDSIGVASYKYKGLSMACFSGTGPLAEHDAGFEGLGSKSAIRDCDLITHIGPKETQVTSTRNFTSIEQGQSYRCRDGDIVQTFNVSSLFAHYVHKGKERTVWAQDNHYTGALAGQQWVNPNTLEPSDLVELIEDTPENTDPETSQVEASQDEGAPSDQVSRRALAYSINEALSRLSDGDKAMGEDGFELSHKGVVEYIVLDKPIQWVPQKPVEILFTAPVKSIPEGEYYWVLLNAEGVFVPLQFVNTTPEIGKKDCQTYHVHLSEEAAQNHARILNEFGAK